MIDEFATSMPPSSRSDVTLIVISSSIIAPHSSLPFTSPDGGFRLAGGLAAGERVLERLGAEWTFASFSLEHGGALHYVRTYVLT